MRDFTRIAASSTATDDVTNQVTYRIFNTDYYILVLILLSILIRVMMITGSVLLFWATLYTYVPDVET